MFLPIGLQILNPVNQAFNHLLFGFVILSQRLLFGLHNPASILLIKPIMVEQSYKPMKKVLEFG